MQRLSKAQCLDMLLKSLPTQGGDPLGPVQPLLKVRHFANDVITTDPESYYTNVLGQEYDIKKGNEQVIVLNAPYLETHALTDFVPEYTNVLFQGEETKESQSGGPYSYTANKYRLIYLNERSGLVFDSEATDGINAGRYLPSESMGFNKVLDIHGLQLVTEEVPSITARFDVLGTTTGPEVSGGNATTGLRVSVIDIQTSATSRVLVFEESLNGVDGWGETSQNQSFTPGTNTLQLDDEIEVPLGQTRYIRAKYSDSLTTTIYSSIIQVFTPAASTDLRDYDFANAGAFPNGLQPKQIDVSFDLANDVYDPPYFPFASQNGTLSQVYERVGDGFLIKANAVTTFDAGFPSGEGQQFLSNDAVMRQRIGTIAPVLVKRLYATDGGRVAQRTSVRPENLRQPEAFGFEVDNYDGFTNRNYGTIKPLAPDGSDNIMFLDINVSVHYWGNFGELHPGLGPGTPDEFAIGVNAGQWKRGAGFPDSDGSPTLFFYYTYRDAQRTPAIQFRWVNETSAGSNTLAPREYRFMNGFDHTKAYVVINAVKMRMNGSQPQARGKYWFVTVEDFMNNYVQNGAFNGSANPPVPDFNENFFFDENPDPTYRVGGVTTSGYHYASAYSGNGQYSQYIWDNNPGREYLELQGSAATSYLIQRRAATEYSGITDDQIFRTAVNMFAPNMDPSLL